MRCGCRQEVREEISIQQQMTMQAERAAKEIAEAEALAERQRQEEELQQQLMLAEAGAAAVIAEEEVAAKEKAQKEGLALQVQALMEEATSRGSGSAELVATSSAHRLPDLSSMSLQQLESKKSELESEIVAEDEMKAFLDERGLSEYHELFLSPKAGNCKSLRQITMRFNTKGRIRAAARKLPAFKAMTDEQCEQVAAAVMKK